jgi:hypothetical protein
MKTTSRRSLTLDTERELDVRVTVSHGGVVDQDVEMAEGFLHEFRGLGDVFALCDVRLDG